MYTVAHRVYYISIRLIDNVPQCFKY